MDYTLELCTETQLSILEEISKRTFAEAFESQNNPEDFKSYLNEAFSPERLTLELNNTNSFFFFAKAKDEYLGYFKLNILDAQTDINDPEAAELERIYVCKNHQGKKIGHWMLEKAIRKAQLMNKTYLWLGVWQKNPGAIRFYKKNGFTVFGEHPYYIGNDRQMDWLMRKDI